MPPTADALIDAISDTVGALVNVGAITASADNDRFEAYVWSIIVRAALAEGAAVTYRDPTKKVVNDLLFRTSPGSISSTVQPFTHALIQFPGKPELEAHARWANVLNYPRSVPFSGISYIPFNPAPLQYG